MRPVLTLREEDDAQDQALERELVVRAEPDCLLLRVTSRHVGPPRTQALILSLDAADRLEDFLRSQREARELMGRGA